MLIIPKSWGDFQHYKDRSPPWIKLHKSLLDNYEFQCLPVASRALAPMLWLLASEHEHGQIDATPEKLAFRLRMSENEVSEALNPLIAKGFFEECKQAASKPLAKQKRAATPEAEKSKRQRREDTSAGKPPTCPVQSIVDLYNEVLPEMAGCVVMDESREKAITERWEWVLTTKKPDGTRRAETAEQALDWFRAYFDRARENDFLMGRIPRDDKHKNWKPDIEFLMKTQGLKHVIEKTEVMA